jgi:hypothetical protein
MGYHAPQYYAVQLTQPVVHERSKKAGEHTIQYAPHVLMKTTARANIFQAWCTRAYPTGLLGPDAAHRYAFRDLRFSLSSPK